ELRPLETLEVGGSMLTLVVLLPSVLQKCSDMCIILSEGTALTSILLLSFKYNPVKQLYIEHSERFTSAPQILCHQSFTSGEHIWVVEVGPTTMWSLGLCYKSIPRRGDHSRLGHNSVSWRLQWKNHKLTVCQSSSNIAIGKVTVQPIRIEIALDYEGGTLMFHSIKGHREHLHTFKTVFKERVYPAFSILSNNSESWITFQSGM
uniref:B30.2/SPRY domain-containing protein n=1 Tax=Gouania willdenowi TaxID=441366 RepID=A0A8C5GYS1_GOUWI